MLICFHRFGWSLATKVEGANRSPAAPSHGASAIPTTTIPCSFRFSFLESLPPERRYRSWPRCESDFAGGGDVARA